MRVARVQTSRSDPRITSPNVRCSKQNEGELVSMTTELAGNGETSNDYLTHAWKLGVGGKEVSVAFLYVRVLDRAQGDTRTTRTGCQQIDWCVLSARLVLNDRTTCTPRRDPARAGKLRSW